MSEYKPTQKEIFQRLLAKHKDPERYLHPPKYIPQNWCVDCVKRGECKTKKKKRKGYGPGCSEFIKIAEHD